MRITCQPNGFHFYFAKRRYVSPGMPETLFLFYTTYIPAVRNGVSYACGRATKLYDRSITYSRDAAITYEAIIYNRIDIDAVGSQGASFNAESAAKNWLLSWAMQGFRRAGMRELAAAVAYKRALISDYNVLLAQFDCADML